NHIARLLPSSSPSAYLGYHLEGFFKRTKIRKVQHPVSIYYSYQTHIVEVQAFAHHLCAHEYIYLPFFEIINNCLITVFSSCGIQVHSLNSGLRKNQFQIVFQLFCPKTNGFYIVRTTGTAGARYFLPVTAIVTAQFIVVHVISQAHGTVFTFWNPGTFLTSDIRRIASSVLKNYSLLFPGQRALKRMNQITGKICFQRF